MKRETFFEKFDQLSDAPNAVTKMRELVLEWAATGKLCHNDSVEWKEGVLGDVIELISGQHLLAHEHNEEGRGIPYLTGPSDFGEKSPIPTRWTDQPKVTAQPGDILITVKGSGVGKTNVLVDQPTAIGRQLMAIRVTGANPEFVHVVLKRAAEHFQNAKTGIAIPGIGRKDVLGLDVVLPPLAEQKRIVAKVDELMALCDRLEALQQERETQHAGLARASLSRFADTPTPANLNFLFHRSYTIPPADLRKSILTLAVQGKLVPQDPNDEPALEVLKRIRSEKARLVTQGELKREKAIPKTDDPEVPYDLPNGWFWSRLGDLSLTVTSGSRDWAEHYSNEGAIFVRMGNLSRHSYRLRLDKIQRVAPPSNAEGERTRLESGDVLISITGEVGLLGLIPDGFGEAYINQHTCLVRLPLELRNRFIPEFFRSPFAQEHFNAPQRGLKNSFRLTDVTTLPTPLPPLAEQRRIVAKVDQLMALVDQLETQLAAARATAANLLEALVAELTTA